MSFFDTISDIFSGGVGNLIGGGASAYSNWRGQHEANMTNLKIGRENNLFSARQAQINRDFQERMSNTSWQRGIKDMKAAGINPMLAVSQGGASSPLGNSAQGIAQANQQNELSLAVSSAQDAIRLQAELANMKANNEQTRAQTRLTDAQTAGVVAGLPRKQTEAEVWSTAKSFVQKIKTNPSGLYNDPRNRKINFKYIPNPFKRNF